MLDSAFTPLVVPRVGEVPIDLRGEADRARTRGYADGYAEGRRVALEEARVHEAAQQRRMTELEHSFVHERGLALEALDAARQSVEARVAELAMLGAERIEELALALARGIIAAELSDPAVSAAHAVRRALAEMPVDRWTRIVLNERDAGMLAGDAELSSALSGIEIATSASVDVGGAIVEIEHGAVDTRIARALARAESALRGDDDAGAAIDGDGAA